jgi:hypothetical protein
MRAEYYRLMDKILSAYPQDVGRRKGVDSF